MSSDSRNGAGPGMDGDAWPDAIVFDFDGTLVHAAPDIHQALNSVLTNHQLPDLALDVVTLMIGAGPEELIKRALRRLQVNPADGQVKAMTADFYAAYTKQGNSLSSLYGGVAETLRQLADRGISLGLCSNKPAQICRQLLSDLGVAELFASVEGFQADRPRKPDPSPLLANLADLGSDKHRTLYVGDSKTDVLTARAAGVPVALVSYGYTAIPAAELGADWVIDSFCDLLQLCSQNENEPDPRPAGATGSSDT